MNFWHRLHDELAALQAAWREDRERAQQIKYRRALRKRRVVMPEPRRDSRDWQGDFERMMRGKN